MTTIGHVFIPLDREHETMTRRILRALPVPLELWQPFQQCLSKHLSELTEGEIDREEKFWFDAAHVNAMMIAVVEASPDLRDCFLSLAAFARRTVDRHVGLVFVIS